VWTAQRQHYCHAMDGWMYFCDKRTAFNQLLNFPIQSNAAAVRCWTTPSCTPSAPESSPRGRCPRGGDAADLYQCQKVLTGGRAWKTSLSQLCQSSAIGQNFLALV
jgi:hypothetical protein